MRIESKLVCIILLLLSGYSCQKPHNTLVRTAHFLDSVITKSGTSFSDSSTDSSYLLIRITINSFEQLEMIERDTSVIVLRHCSQGNPENVHPVRYSPSSSSIVYSCCGVETVSDIYIYPLDVYWPKDKSIPDTFTYEILEKEDESVRTLSNKSSLQPAFVEGQIRAYDNRLQEYVPVKNATIRYFARQGGSDVLRYTSTDANGCFFINFPNIYCNVELVLQNVDYVIRNGNTSEVKTINLGAPVFDYYEAIESNEGSRPRANVLPSYMQRDLPSDFFLDVYQSAHYYFNGDNELLNQATQYDAGCINIFAINGEDAEKGHLGTFSYYHSGSPLPYITIYNPYVNNYSEAASKVFGTVLHELGHATHYTNEGASTYYSVSNIIKESFASLFGWLNVWHYYSTVTTNHANVNSICTQGRQTWQAISDTLYYTPFYIDLYDNYNQAIYYPTSAVVYDNISNVPVSVILSLVFGHTSFSTVLSQLATYTDIYFNATDYSSFSSPYIIFQ